MVVAFSINQAIFDLKETLIPLNEFIDCRGDSIYIIGMNQAGEFELSTNKILRLVSQNHLDIVRDILNRPLRRDTPAKDNRRPHVKQLALLIKLGTRIKQLSKQTIHLLGELAKVFAIYCLIVRFTQLM